MDKAALCFTSAVLLCHKKVGALYWKEPSVWVAVDMGDGAQCFPHAPRDLTRGSRILPETSP